MSLSLTAPASSSGRMFSMAARNRRRGARNQRRPRRVRDGQIVASSFNTQAGRPYPPIRSLTDTITVQMTSVNDPYITTSTITNVYTAANFTLNSFGGYTAYTALFDQYKIQEIEIWLEPSANNISSGFSLYATAIDLDDSVTPTTFASVADHQGALVTGGACGHYHRFVPHIAVASYAGTFTGFTNNPDQWIDSASPAVQHYGLKTALLTTAVAIGYNLTVRAKVSFRAPGIN